MRGPALEQIEGGDRTFRVEVEYLDGSRETVPGYEILDSHVASEAYRKLWMKVYCRIPGVAALCVVNERTGVARDRISRG